MELSLVLCDYLEGWDGVGGGGRAKKREHMILIHVDVWQEPTKHCKAIILQLKMNKLKSC